MPLIGILLSRYWKLLALGALLAGAIAYRAVLLHQLNAARERVTQLTAEAAALRINNQALGAMIDRQNAAVAELKARADAAVNTMAANEAAADRAGTAVQAQAQQQAQSLMTAAIDADSGCEGAIRWGNAQAPELSAW
jgi:hypothetical protein